MSYKQDPNDNTKQIPDSPPFSDIRNEAVCPASEALTDPPNHIIINQPGAYMFAYKSGSVSTYTTGSVISGDTDRGNPAVRLDIQPVAWHKVNTTAAVGDVTFVYKRRIY